LIIIITSYIEQIQKKIKSTQDQITNTESNINQSIETLTTQVNQLQTSEQSLQDEIQQLQTDEQSLRDEIQQLQEQLTTTESENNTIIQTIQNQIQILQDQLNSNEQNTETQLLEKETRLDDLFNKTYTLSNNIVVTALDFVYVGSSPTPTYSNNVLSYTKPSTINNKFIYYLYQNQSFQFGSQNITDIPPSVDVTNLKMRDLYRWLVGYRLYNSNNPTNANVFIQIYTKPKNDGLDFEIWYRSRYYLTQNLGTQQITNQQKYLNIELNSINYNPISNTNSNAGQFSLSKLSTFEQALDDDILALSIQSASNETNEFTFDLLYSNLIYKK